MVFAGEYSGCQQRPYSTDGKGRFHSLPSREHPGATHSSVLSRCRESQRNQGSKQPSRGVTFPGPRRHSQLRGPHGPRGPGGSGRHASRAGDLDTLRPLGKPAEASSGDAGLTVRRKGRRPGPRQPLGTSSGGRPRRQPPLPHSSRQR